MDSSQFRKCAKELIDYVADYLDNIRSRPVFPDVQPGYLSEIIPSKAPEHPDKWDDILKDVERIIMPGMTHWHSPHFHAYYPTANSFPAICADILSSSLSCIGFTWAGSPACTELEMSMMDWLGNMLQLPEEFLFSSGGQGGGVIQGTASEATLVALMAARTEKIRQIQSQHLEIERTVLLGKFVAYCSDQSHSSVEKAGFLAEAKMRSVLSDKDLSLRGFTLEAAIQEDIAKGNIPFFVVATLGTTSTCAFDNILELGDVCKRYNLWLHVDAAYAGSAFICPEFRPMLNGIELADSFNLNPHKWMLVNFDCSAMWVKNRNHLIDSFSVSPAYLKHDKEGQIPDYRHWQIPLGRRFRSLKMWFVFRMYGVEGLRNHIRKQVCLAHHFEAKLKADSRFEIVYPVIMGLVCFRVKGPDSLNEEILKKINNRRKIHITPTKVRDKYIIRFAICSRMTTEKDVDFAWEEIKTVVAQCMPKK